MINVHCMFYSARPAHCNGKPEGNMVRPSWAGLYRSLTDTTLDMGIPRTARRKRLAKNLSSGMRRQGTRRK